MIGTSLRNTLRQTRRRATAIGMGAGVGWGAVAAILFLTLGMWADLLLDLPAALRVATLVGAVACSVILLGCVLRATRRRSEPLNLARRLDQVGQTDGQILSAVDLMLSPAAAGEELTTGMAGMAIERAEQLSAGASVAAAVPARPVGRALGGLALLIAALAILAFAAPRLVRTQWLRFSDPFGDHPPYARTVFTVTPGNVKVVYGSAVDIRASAVGLAVDNVDLVLESQAGPSETVPMFPEPDGHWRATLTDVTAAGRYFVRARGARSNRYRIDVVTTPNLQDVRFRITPPAYTNRPAYDGPLPQGGISGLPGTRVEIFARSNRPLAGGSLEFFTAASATTLPATRLGLSPSTPPSSQVTGAFTITTAGKLRLKVRDVANQESTDALVAPVMLLVDQRPFVRIIEPKAYALATPDVMLPVTLAAEDDYGISRLQLFRSLNDSAALPMELPVPKLAPTQLTPTLQLPLASYGLTPGDTIKLFARVEDNDPAGAKGSESAIVVIQIISQEDFDRLSLAQAGLETLLSKYEAAERRLEALRAEADALAKDLKNDPPDSPLSEAHKKRLAELAKEMNDDAAELRDAAKSKLPLDVDKALSDELAKLADQVQQAQKDVEAAQSLPSGAVADALAKVAQQLGAGQAQFQQHALAPLEHLAQIFPLIQDEARFVQLYQRQRELADRLASLVGQDDVDDPKIKARMRDLEGEQRELREGLDTLLDDIENHARLLPDDPRLNDLRQTAVEIARQVRESGASEAMQVAESGLAEFSGTYAHTGAKQAADLLEKFISRTQGLGGIAGNCLKFNPKLAAVLGQTIAQLLGAQGLSNMQGSGQGGQSMASNNMRNTSLYGRRPMAAGGGAHAGSRQVDAGPGAGGALIGHKPGESADANTAGSVSASGASDAAVPPQYQRRVGEYFRRVADDMDQK